MLQLDKPFVVPKLIHSLLIAGAAAVPADADQDGMASMPLGRITKQRVSHDSRKAFGSANGSKKAVWQPQRVRPSRRLRVSNTT